MSKTERTWQRQWLDVARELAPPEDPGQAYAVRFEAGLRLCMRERVIDDWRQTKQFSEEDSQGVDFWVAVGGEQFGLQITSKRVEAQRRRRKHPDVYVIYMLDRYSGELKTDEELRQEVEDGIKSYRDKAAKGEVMFGYRSGIG